MKYRTGIVHSALAALCLTGCSPPPSYQYSIGKNYRIKQSTIDELIGQLEIDVDTMAWIMDTNGDKILSKEEIIDSIGTLEGFLKP